jgi:hypothetical protein
MVITGGKGFKVVVSLDGSGIFALCVSYCSGIFCQFAIENIISDVSAKKESLVRDDGIGGKGRSFE